MIPNIKLDVIERCSGHGGLGVKKDNFNMAIKVENQFQERLSKVITSMLFQNAP